MEAGKLMAELATKLLDIVKNIFQSSSYLIQPQLTLAKLLKNGSKTHKMSHSLIISTSSEEQSSALTYAKYVFDTPYQKRSKASNQLCRT